LDEEETAAWVALAGMMAALPAALDAQLRRDAGMGLADYQVLSWLSMSPGRATRMTVLAEMATISQSHLSRVAARLEHRGWLRRVPDPDDGRGTLAELTEAGWETVCRAAPGHVAEVQRLVFGNLPATRVRQLEQISRTVLEAARPGYCMRIPARPVNYP
jgi:DNA-binding MarR family transcriptional regulator